MSAPAQTRTTLEAAAEAAMRAAAARLEALQQRDGHWCAELTADTTLESDYILFQLWLYPPTSGRWEPETRPLIDKAAHSVLDRQLPGGGFNIYPGGPPEISASVKAYIALKLAGVAVDDPRMASLRRCILELGGIQAANSYVKVNLSLFGLYPREFCPSIPPELALLPFRLLYQMSSWTRAIVLPLAIVYAANPCRPLPAGFHLDEIWLPGAGPDFRRKQPRFGWHNSFLAADGIFKWWERRGSKALQRKAIRRAEAWMVERIGHSDGLGAIYPPMMYSVMALDALGYAPDHPVRVEALRQFNRLMVDAGDRFFFQPCFSPVWDTAIAAYALAQAGARGSLGKAADWLIAREVRRQGDWSVKRPRIEPSGWAFEYNNPFYPDIDDTAMVMLALSQADGGDAAAQQACHRRAMDWLLAMQSRDGGWAAFDADNDCHRAMRRGVEWLVGRQEADGSWYGRWGVAYIYGTCFALRGLAAAGESDREAHVLRAGEWLRSIQNADGGWGESCASYDNGAFTAGESTPSQTAWAIMGLVAGGDAGSLSVRQGIEYLLETQNGDGSWDEELATGTGFPKVFYLNYHLYKDYFPLLALASFVRGRNENG
jgi:squalene-hopene/tetraprenyl-beta-curcumene cyclase